MQLSLQSFITNYKVIFALVSLITVMLLVDTSVVKIYYFSLNQLLIAWRIIIFFIICSIFLVGIYVLFVFTRQKTKDLRSSKLIRMKTLSNIVVISQFSLAAIMVSVMFEMIVSSRYSVVLLIAATSISYTTAFIMMLILAMNFFAWFTSNRNLVVFLYGLSSIMFAINLAFTIIFVSLVLANVPVYVVPHMAAGYPFFSLGSFTDLINYGYTISSILSFTLWWIATVSVLRHYSKKSMKKYWVAFSIPLIYFLIQFQPLFIKIFSSFLTSEPVLLGSLYTIAFTLSKPIGGILFSIAFWVIARKLDYNSNVRNYMIVSAYGVLLIFASNQASILVNVAYPPFGLATASFVGLSSYLVLVGIYSSAISVAEDSKLRKSIRDLAVKQENLLDSIGTAQMEQNYVRKVLTIVKENQESLKQETGVESSITEEDMKDYLEEVLKEVKLSKMK